MAWTGRATLQQVENYTRKVEQDRLALSAAKKLTGRAAQIPF
ncbi:MAG TPA: hypothetical protein VF007_12855 [Stellaceae bacterium]